MHIKGLARHDGLFACMRHILIIRVAHRPTKTPWICMQCFSLSFSAQADTVCSHALKNVWLNTAIYRKQWILVIKSAHNFSSLWLWNWMKKVMCITSWPWKMRRQIWKKKKWQYFILTPRLHYEAQASHSTHISIRDINAALHSSKYLLAVVCP